MLHVYLFVFLIKRLQITKAENSIGRTNAAPKQSSSDKEIEKFRTCVYGLKYAPKDVDVSVSDTEKSDDDRSLEQRKLVENSSAKPITHKKLQLPTSDISSNEGMEIKQTTEGDKTDVVVVEAPRHITESDLRSMLDRMDMFGQDL